MSVNCLIGTPNHQIARIVLLAWIVSAPNTFPTSCTWYYFRTILFGHFPLFVVARITGLLLVANDQPSYTFVPVDAPFLIIGRLAIPTVDFVAAWLPALWEAWWWMLVENDAAALGCDLPRHRNQFPFATIVVPTFVATSPCYGSTILVIWHALQLCHLPGGGYESSPVLFLP
jgi:hypothetical protein